MEVGPQSTQVDERFPGRAEAGRPPRSRIQRRECSLSRLSPGFAQAPVPQPQDKAADSLNLIPWASGSGKGLPEGTVKVNVHLWAGICESSGPKQKATLPMRGTEGRGFLDRGGGG